MSLLYETNALFMKGFTNQWEIQNAVAINLTFFLIRERKNIIQISCKCRSYIVLRKMCKNSEVIVAHHRLRNFYSSILICTVLLKKKKKTEIMKLFAYSYKTK